VENVTAISIELEITGISKEFLNELGGDIITIYGHGFPFAICSFCPDEYITVFFGNAMASVIQTDNT
jgi:hypothetical protein